MEIDNLLENTSIVSNDTINTIELEEFPKEGCCKTDQIELRDYLKNKFPSYIQKSWRSYYNIVAWNEIGYWFCEEKSSKPEYQLSQLQKFFTKEEVKQPLKQVVHCITQEEWDFVLSKLSKSSFLSKQSDKFTKYNDYCRHEGGIAVNINDCGYSDIEWYKNKGCQILSFQEWCNLNGYKMEKEVAKTLIEPIKDEVKQSLKQVVHCITQEEWDFVSEKINYKFSTVFNLGLNDTINVSKKRCESKLFYERRSEYQVLSFQEWCDLNGYKMEKKVEFEFGKWYSIKTAYNWIIKFKEIKDGSIRANWHCLNERGKKVEEGGSWESKPTEIKELSIEEIQQYLPDNHPDKIKSNIKFKVGDWVINLENSISYNVNEICRVSKINKTHLACENKPQGEDSMKPFNKFRHATPEEIQQYLPDDHPDKIKSNQEFKVGDYIILENAYGWSYSSCNNGCLGLITKISDYKPHIVDKYICSITGDILNSKNKDTKFEDVPVAIYEGKWIVRHATPEEINNHLISIGQIPIGEPLNTGIEPNKDNSYSCISVNRGENPQCTFNSIKINGQEILKPKMILSIDDEELPMVNIIKTNTIKQLLNND